MRRSLSLLVVTTAAFAGSAVAAVTGAGTAHACSCTEATDVSAFEMADTVFVGTVTDVERPTEIRSSVPDTTVAAESPAEEEDRTAGYLVMVAAVLVFFGGFAIIARRSRKR